MDNIIYLYKLTLSNYINDKYINEPIFETILINSVSKNIGLLNNKDLIYFFITFLHLELDTLFHKYPKEDVKFAVQKLEEEPNTRSPRLNADIKNVARRVYETYINLVKS